MNHTSPPFLRTVAAALACLAALPGATQTLRIHNGGDVKSLDPHRLNGIWENRVVGDLFEGLMAEAADATPVLGMAASHEVSADGLVHTFVLRPDARWSDGTPVTAHDFLFAFRRLFDPADGARQAALQYPIRNARAVHAGEAAAETLGVEAVDERTVRFTLEEPAPFFLAGLTHYTAYPLPRHVIATHGGDGWVRPGNIVTNGPFIPAEWVAGSHVTAVPNPEHYAHDTIQLAAVIYDSLEDEAAALRRYEAGEFDILTSFPVDQIDRLRAELGDQLHLAPFSGLYFYSLNHNDPALADARVREALSMAVNRVAITRSILGTGEEPAYGWVPPGLAHYHDPYRVAWADEPYADRVARARELMEQAGFGPANPLPLTIRYNTNASHKRIAVAIAAMWKPLGVDVELHNTEIKVHYEDLRNNDFQVGRASWTMDYNDPFNILMLLRSDHDVNFGDYASADYDHLLATSAQQTDLTARAKTLRAAETAAMADHASIPIYFLGSRNIVAPRVRGFVDNPFDIHRARHISLD